MAPTSISHPNLDHADMPATDDSSDHTPSSSPVLSFTQSADSVTSSEESMGDSLARVPSRVGRYPAHLSHGSPPRKPRLNSDQYETMEDLLAAAGYSVTRVFTPETERTLKMETKEEQAGAGIGSMFAGLITHLLSPAPSKLIQPAATGSNPPLSVQRGGQYPQATRSVSASIKSLGYLVSIVQNAQYNPSGTSCARI